MKLKVLLIDPWGTANTSEYLNGLIYGLSSVTELTVFTNTYFELKVESKADINKIFFHFFVLVYLNQENYYLNIFHRPFLQVN